MLVAALAYGDGAKGGRPPYDPVAMLKVLVLAAQNNVADARMEYLIRDRLSWLRFLGFDLGAATPDANTIRLFREKLTEAGALAMVFADFDRQLKERGYLAMGGQIVDATLVAAPKQIPWGWMAARNLAGWSSPPLNPEATDAYDRASNQPNRHPH